MTFLRSFGNYDVDAASNESALLCLDKTLSKQSFRDECDINVIVDRFGVGYELPEGGIPASAFGEFHSAADFHDLANRIAVAHENFDLLHADIRSRFHNDPANLLTFLSDSSNRGEAEKFGLVLPKALEPVISPALPVVLPVPS